MHQKNPNVVKQALGIDFQPFQAWRYSPKQVELSRVIAPPYDVISPAEQDALYTRSPFNVVRLILGKENNFYEHARQCWEEWTQRGILVQDERPAIYLYEQVFHHPLDSHPMRRLAMVGRLNLNPSDLVLRHEATFEGPKKDRFLLLEKTQTNLSPIFGLYQDSRNQLTGLFSSYRNTPPLFQATDGEGVLHQGWAVEKEEEQKIIREVIQGQKIFIADGHHRFETAVEYRRRMHERFPDAKGENPYDFVMMALVDCEDEGLVVLPTHRILPSLKTCSPKEFLDRLRVHFEFLSYPSRELFSQLSRRPQGEKVFGMVMGKNEGFLLCLKNLEAVRKSLPKGKPPLWYEVEANLLTHFVFQDEVVKYTRSWEEAVQEVNQGRAEVAFLLRAPEVDTIRKLADTGERMPQKTTYFYPKLASGLFFYHHE